MRSGGMTSSLSSIFYETEVIYFFMIDMSYTSTESKIIILGLLIVLVSSPIALLWYFYKPDSIESFPLSMRVPSFIVSTVNGTTFSLSSSGKKQVLILFTAECSSCRAELANLNCLYAHFKSQIDFFALSLSNSDITKLLLTSEKYSFPVFQAERNASIDSMIINPPTMLFVDEQRILRHRYSGDRTLEKDKRLIQEFSNELFIQKK